MIDDTLFNKEVMQQFMKSIKDEDLQFWVAMKKWGTLVSVEQVIVVWAIRFAQRMD